MKIKKKTKYKVKPKKFGNGALDLDAEATAGSNMTGTGGTDSGVGLSGAEFTEGGINGGQVANAANFGVGAALNVADSVATNNTSVNHTIGEKNPYEKGVGGKSALKGAAAGASAGMAFGPWGAAIGGAIGAGAGLVKGLVNSHKRKEWNERDAQLRDSSKINQKYEGEDLYNNLKYAKGTKYKKKANTKVSEYAKKKADIEFEGGEPIFSPKKNDGTRDLLYYDPNGPKHSEGGIPANVVDKNKYKFKKGTSSIVDVPEGSAIVTAKKDLGKQAVVAYKMGKPEIVEKIISKMPKDTGTKKVDGDGDVKNNEAFKANQKIYSDANSTPEQRAAAQKAMETMVTEHKAKLAEADKKARTKSSQSTSKTTFNDDSEQTFKFDDLSPEDYDKLSPIAKAHEDHKAVLLDAQAKKGGKDLTIAEQEEAFAEASKKDPKVQYTMKGYRDSIRGMDEYAISKGQKGSNLRGNTEGKFAGEADDNTGMFGKRNARLSYNLGQKVSPAKPGAAEQLVPPGDVSKMSKPEDKPIEPAKTPGPGLGIGMPRLSDLNNMYQGLKKPEVETYARVSPEKYKYYDLSDPSRRESMKAAKMQAMNAVNLSGGSAGNARANINSAYAQNAERQQDINNKELGRFDVIKKANVDVANTAAYKNTDITNLEKDANAANRQATRDQFQLGLVGNDEHQYRSKVTRDQYNVDMQKNAIEAKKMNMLHDLNKYDYNNDTYRVNFKKPPVVPPTPTAPINVVPKEDETLIGRNGIKYVKPKYKKKKKS
jgi:hypothetical protein